jgi:hypothetical protein
VQSVPIIINIESSNLIRLLTDFVCLYTFVLMSFDFPFVRLFEFGNFVITLIWQHKSGHLCIVLIELMYLVFLTWPFPRKVQIRCAWVHRHCVHMHELTKLPNSNNLTKGKSKLISTKVYKQTKSVNNRMRFELSMLVMIGTDCTDSC